MPAALVGAGAALVLLGAPAVVGVAALADADREALGERARSSAAVVLAAAPGAEAGGALERLVVGARDPGLLEVLVVVDGRETSSATGLGVQDLPREVRDELATGRRVEGVDDDVGPTVEGGRALVVGLAEESAQVVVLASTAPVEARASATGVRAGGAVLLSAALAAGATGLGARARLRTEREAHERERELTADLAHELRTPVSTLVAASSLVAPITGQLPESGREPVQLMLAETERLHRLVEDMLQLSRLEHGDGDVDLEDVAVLPLVREVLAARGWVGDVAVTSEEGVVARADRRVLARITVNVVENARRHGAGQVRVGARLERGLVVLEVEDDGAGVAPEDRERVFDRFTTTGTSTSGLGLPLVRAGARAMGGDAHFDEAPGGGARVVVSLPRAGTT
ncbi:HAMP domain-containing sensor histidine kinase [Pseudokineococcus marinus]|uniref:sensor histidine kinase n=1 Tax=Pseudokineococcus marinus TaxID=351215 RepID=UPI0030B4636C